MPVREPRLVVPVPPPPVAVAVACTHPKEDFIVSSDWRYVCTHCGLEIRELMQDEMMDHMVERGMLPQGVMLCEETRGPEDEGPAHRWEIPSHSGYDPHAYIRRVLIDIDESWPGLEDNPKLWPILLALPSTATLPEVRTYLRRRRLVHFYKSARTILSRVRKRRTVDLSQEQLATLYANLCDFHRAWKELNLRKKIVFEEEKLQKKTLGRKTPNIYFTLLYLARFFAWPEVEAAVRMDVPIVYTREVTSGSRHRWLQCRDFLRHEGLLLGRTWPRRCSARDFGIIWAS